MTLKIRQILGASRPLLILAAVFVLCAALSPTDGQGANTFLTWGSQTNMLRFMSEYGILAAGMTLVILSGGIDLSVGSILGFTAVLFSWMTIWKDVPAVLAVPACLAAGAALGGVNGFLVARFRIQPFVVTLAMMVVARGLAKLVSGGQKVSTAFEQNGDFVTKPIPPFFDFLNDRIGGTFPVVGVVFLAAILLLWGAARYTLFGRHLYAIGGNEEAARLSGVRVGWAKAGAYAVSGLMAALAGLCDAAQQQQGDPEAGATYELDAIAAVVIGGTALTGGRGSMSLTLVGVLVIGYIDQILSLKGFDQSQRLIAKGLIILGAVLLQKRERV